MATTAATNGTCDARTARRAALVVLAVALLFVPLAAAGTIELAWQNVSDPDVVRYNVYFGTDPDKLHDQTPKSVPPAPGNTTSTTLDGLADCTTWYAVVYAYDGEFESTQPSNLVKGFPRPRVSSVVPNKIRAGETVEVTVTGVNFDVGDPSDAGHVPSAARVWHKGLELKPEWVTSVTVDDCNTLRFQFSPDASTSIGSSDLEVLNIDRSHANPSGKDRVFGRLAAAISVLSTDGTSPSVLATSPADGAGDVSARVRPTLTFSEPVDPTSVTVSTVRLLDEAGNAVSQIAGSPQVAGETVTIFPASPLTGDATYRLEAKGGSAGVRDLAGNVLASDFIQTTGFAVRLSDQEPPDRHHRPRVVSSWPQAGQTDVAPTLDEIRVTFDRDMTPLFDGLAQDELATRFTVMDGRSAVPQTATSPRLEGSGQTVVIELAAPLQDGQTYTTMVQLAGAEVSAQLSGLGLSEFEMDQLWSTRPAWRVEGGLASASYRDPDTGASTSLTDGGSSLAERNTGVPVNAEFVLSFDTPVSASSQTPGVFRLRVQQGRRFEVVEVLEPLSAEDGGRSIVLRPAQPLPAGALILIDIRTGSHGVVLEGSEGPYALGGGSPIQVLFATEVSGAALDSGLAVGE